MTPDRAPLRVGVLGTGAIAQVVHVPILAEREDVELALVADVDRPKARTVAERFGVPEATGPDGVLEREDLDAVVVCAPNHLHEEMAVAALGAGKHVFVERPAALTPEGVERVLEAAAGAGRVLVVGLPHRFRPDAAALRSFVAGGDLGDVYAVRASWLVRRTPPVRTTWRERREQAGGGALMDLGLPTLDLALWLLDYPRIPRVSCALRVTEDGVEDAATLLAVSDGGVSVTLEVSNRYFGGEDSHHARVLGTEGSGWLPPLALHRLLGGRPLDVTPRQPRPRGGENPYTNAYRRQLDHFVRAVHGRIEAPPPREQVALMRILRAAYDAAAAGAEVTL